MYTNHVKIGTVVSKHGYKGDIKISVASNNLDTLLDLKYLFIDEFQDTSFLQWQNIIPLSTHSILNEGIDEAHGSIFLVGDPKQSIYRWRGANPEIFSSLKKNFSFSFKT